MKPRKSKQTWQKKRKPNLLRHKSGPLFMPGLLLAAKKFALAMFFQKFSEPGLRHAVMMSWVISE
jgi:hypothetical protein